MAQIFEVVFLKIASVALHASKTTNRVDFSQIICTVVVVACAAGLIQAPPASQSIDGYTRDRRSTVLTDQVTGERIIISTIFLPAAAGQAIKVIVIVDKCFS